MPLVVHDAWAELCACRRLPEAANCPPVPLQACLGGKMCVTPPRHRSRTLTGRRVRVPCAQSGGSRATAAMVAKRGRGDTRLHRCAARLVAGPLRSHSWSPAAPGIEGTLAQGARVFGLSAGALPWVTQDASAARADPLMARWPQNAGIIPVPPYLVRPCWAAASACDDAPRPRRGCACTPCLEARARGGRDGRR